MDAEFFIQEAQDGHARMTVEHCRCDKAVDVGANLPFAKMVLADEIERSGKKTGISG